MQIGILKYRYMEKREKNHRKMSNPKLSFFSFPQELQKKFLLHCCYLKIRMYKVYPYNNFVTVLFLSQEMVHLMKARIKQAKNEGLPIFPQKVEHFQVNYPLISVSLEKVSALIHIIRIKYKEIIQIQLWSVIYRKHYLKAQPFSTLRASHTPLLQLYEVSALFKSKGESLFPMLFFSTD